VFSCGMGAVRTTYAMVAALVVRRRLVEVEVGGAGGGKSGVGLGLGSGLGSGNGSRSGSGTVSDLFQTVHLRLINLPHYP